MTGCAPTPELVALLSSHHFKSIVVGSSDVFAVTWDAFHVTGSIEAAPRDGSGATRIVAEFAGEPTSLAADASRVYWTNAADGTVASCPIAGCKGPPDVIATGQRNPTRVVVDEGNAYWINPMDASSGGEVIECPLTGCGDSPKVLASGQQTSGAGLVVDATHVYWTNGGPALPDSSGTWFDGNITRTGK